MNILLNGKTVEIEVGTSINELLKNQNVEMQDYVTVQLNEDLVEREDFDTLILSVGDAVEFIYFMGGGQNGLF